MSPQGCWRPPDEGRVGPLIDFGLFVFYLVPGCLFARAVCFFKSRLSPILCSFCVVFLCVLSHISAHPLLCFCRFCFVFLLVLAHLSAHLVLHFYLFCLIFVLVLLILLLVLFHLSARLSPLSDRPVSSFCLLSLSLSLFISLSLSLPFSLSFFLSFFLWPSPHCGGHPPGPLWPGGVSPGMPQGTDSPCSHKLDCRVTGG